MIDFFWYPRCGTCQKAKKWLEANNISYEAIDLKEVKPNRQQLEDWFKKSGLPLKKFFNTSGQVYKAMELKDKLPSMSQEEQLDLLASDGMLVKRPILISGDTVLVGFKETDWEEKLR
ncbi:MAG: arsenate reductase family protein [Spirochaetaceae bacterium]|nr:arsenate reductase family protein [Spirochaetaceae bacterium]